MEEIKFTPKKAEDVLGLFKTYKKAKGSKGGYFVSCPFHGSDSDPSLHIYDSDATGEHRLMVKCFGCDVPKTAILDYINSNGSTLLDVSELELIASGKRKPKEVEDVPLTLTNTYTYKDRKGNLIYQVLRYEPKTFRYRRPTTPEEKEDSGRSWLYSQSGIEPQLYHLELIEAVQKNSPETVIFKLEGEGKCDFFRSMKLVATCNPFGGTSGKFLPKFAEELTNTNVVLIPDNDLTGYNHIHEVAGLLLPVVKSLKIVILPRLEKLHDDVKDWFNKYGGTREELLSLVSFAEELKEKSIGYIKEKYPYTFIEKDNEVSINLSELDALIEQGKNQHENTYSEKLQGFLERGRKILDEEGHLVSLCPDCLNTGFILGKNEDGHYAVLAEKTVDLETGEDGSAVVLKTCNHGQFEEEISDFNF
ncbi:MAG TPA: hypothetical protein PLP33_27760 [Leptospiraceae bacterium]|nr:hypothetical protein [Leptospiraceae bacterium]